MSIRYHIIDDMALNPKVKSVFKPWTNTINFVEKDFKGDQITKSQ